MDYHYIWAEAAGEVIQCQKELSGKEFLWNYVIKRWFSLTLTVKYTSKRVCLCLFVCVCCTTVVDTKTDRQGVVLLQACLWVIVLSEVCCVVVFMVVFTMCQWVSVGAVSSLAHAPSKIFGWIIHAWRLGIMKKKTWINL